MKSTPLTKTRDNRCPICGLIADTMTGHNCGHLRKVQANGLRVWGQPPVGEDPRSIYKILADRLSV